MLHIHFQFLEIKNEFDIRTGEHIDQLLQLQVKEAQWWRDACLAYFQSKSKLPWPDGITPPAYSVEHYMELQNQLKFVPGI